MPSSENSQLITLMFATKRTLMQRFKDRKGFDPISYFRSEILRYLKDHPNPKMKDVADYLGITPPSATIMIDKMVKENFIERAPDAKDRRKIILKVTKKGDRFFTKTFKAMHGIIEEVFKQLNSKDKKDLIRIYKKSNK